MGSKLLALLALSIIPCGATTYNLATAAGGGSDSNNGLTTGTPWLTPNHPVSCGDVIVASASTAYSADNFYIGDWGTVTCSAGNNVAWLQCVTFDACKISSSSHQGMWVDASYWGIQGWEITTTGSASACFFVSPNFGTPVEIHHVIFANDVANGCQQGGLFLGYQTATASVDYVAFVGNIAYNAASGSGSCESGITVFQPIQSDSLPGTHIYVAGNFVWGNFNSNPCNGAAPTDGQGLMLDTPDGSQVGTASPYTAQIVYANNISVGNGGPGMKVFNNSVGSTHAPVYVQHNTIWGNNGDTSEPSTDCGESVLIAALNVQETQNLSSTAAATACDGNTAYAYFVYQGGASDIIYGTVGWSATGTYGGISSSPGFSYGPNNLFGTNPQFANPTVPGAPSCGTATSVPNCMGVVVANFTPTNSAVTGYGYQVPSAVPVYDPFFPQWLCNVNLPAGLVSMGCVQASGSTASMGPGASK